MSWLRRIPAPVWIVLAALLALEGCAAYFQSDLCYEDEVSTQVSADEGIFSPDGRTVFLAAFVERYRKPEGFFCGFPDGGRHRIERQAAVFFSVDLASGTARRLGVVHAPEGFQLDVGSTNVLVQPRAGGIVHFTAAGRKPRRPLERPQNLRYEADLNTGRVRPLTDDEWDARPAGATDAQARRGPDGDRVWYRPRSESTGVTDGGFVVERGGRGTARGVLLPTDALARAVDGE